MSYEAKVAAAADMYISRTPVHARDSAGNQLWTRKQIVRAFLAGNAAVIREDSPAPHSHVMGGEPRRPQPLDPRGMSISQINAHILDLELELRRRDGTIAPENPMSFFMSSVDSWGAAEWFDRLANAIRKQDEAAVAMHRASENDKVYREADFDLYRMIAHSSAMRLVRDYEPQIRAALSAPEAEG